MRFSKTAASASGTERPGEAGASEAGLSEAPEGSRREAATAERSRSMRSRSRLIRNATIAALVGSAAGAVAGVWSVRARTTSVAASPMSAGGDPAASSASPPTHTASDQSRRDLAAPEALSNPIAVATQGIVQPAAPAAVVRSGPAQNDSQTVVQRARALADVPDVYALVALRESVIRRAAERGDQESPATQELIREVERHLAEARRLRLKLDGEALRRDQAAHPPRTGR